LRQVSHRLKLYQEISPKNFAWIKMQPAIKPQMSVTWNVNHGN
jgi:hypothetical protein